MGPRRERLWAIGLGLLAFVWYQFFAPSGLAPEVWGETAVAASLRAPDSLFPGLFRSFSGLLFAKCGFATACLLLGVFGKALAALSVALAFCLLRNALRCAGTPLEVGTPKRRLAGFAIAFVPAVMFAVSESMLEMSETLSSDLLLLVLSFAALTFLFRFFDRGGTFNGGAALVLFGAVAAETPMGLLLGAVAGTLYRLFVRGWTGFAPRPPSVFRREKYKWLATIAFAAGFFGVAFLNIRTFIRAGGLAANGFTGLFAVLRYIYQYGVSCVASATGTGWLLIVAAVILPLILAAKALPRAASDERFLPWHLGVIYAVLAAFAAVQLGSFDALWFRSWTSVACLRSPYLVNLCAFLIAVTLVLSLAALAVEAFFRNVRRILRLTIGEESPDRIDFVRARRRRLALAICVPAALLLLACPFGRYGVRREMRAIVDGAVKEIAREAGDAKWLFTDGALDDGIELAAQAARGRPLYTLSMMAPAGHYADYLRTRGGFEGEDAASAAVSAANVFRDWVLNRPERVAESAFLLGFEMWRAAAKTEPAGSGFLARTVYGTGEPERGVAAAKELSGRLLDFCGAHSEERRRAAGPVLHRLFAIVSWRLSRLAVLRADALERGGKRELAAAERELSEKLDATNPYLADLNRYRRSTAGKPREDVSLREKLKLALMRADFRNAAVFARTVLVTDPGNVDAHFAMGMYNYFLGNYALAETHLVKALDARPKDGVLWNNLAMCQLRQKCLETAEKSALQAVHLLPESTAASNTLIEIRRERGGRT